MHSTTSSEDSTDFVPPSRGASLRKKRIHAKPIVIVKELTFNNNCSSCNNSSNQSNSYFQGAREASALLHAAENNSTAANCGCRRRSRHGLDDRLDSLDRDSSSLVPSPGTGMRPKSAEQRRQQPATVGCGVRNRTAAGDLISCCAQQTAEQAWNMRVKGTDCKRGDPYAALRAETFRKLLKNTGNSTKEGARGRKAQPGKPARKKIKFCKPKVDECDGVRLQLCPNLGEGHTHEKLIEEVTPVLLRAALNLNCQLREICRRLFFMRHNVPQLTAPALVNFHGILAEITRMLIADFSSFPTGLKLPDRGDNRKSQQL